MEVNQRENRVKVGKEENGSGTSVSVSGGDDGCDGGGIRLLW